MIYLLYTVVCLLFAIITLGVLFEKAYHSAVYPAETYPNKAVFISGCDTGFGEAAALTLDKLGFKVFAGCLTKEGGEKLKNRASSKLVTIQVDVSKTEDIERMVKVITDASPEGLWAVINNAGIAIGAPVEWLPIADIRRIFDINFFGFVSVTKALLPLVRKTRGRIINVSSVAGYVCIPHFAAYSATKYAMEGFSDSLRREMFHFGVDIVLIEPFFTKTNLTHRAMVDYTSKIWDGLSPYLKEEYTQEYFDRSVQIGTLAESTAQSIDPVIAAYVESVTTKHPKTRYRVGKGTTVIAYALALLPTILIDKVLRPFFAKPSSSRKQSKK